MSSLRAWEGVRETHCKLLHELTALLPSLTCLSFATECIIWLYYYYYIRANAIKSRFYARFTAGKHKARESALIIFIMYKKERANGSNHSRDFYMNSIFATKKNK